MKSKKPKNKLSQTEIKLGYTVQDIYGDVGVVVKIEPGYNTEDHGTIYVWQINKFSYGADNCEHYCHFDWQKSLTIIGIP